MDKYTLIRISKDGEKVIKTFAAPNVKTACSAHLSAWKKKVTSHAVVLELPDGTRHSHNDSVAFLA